MSWRTERAAEKTSSGPNDAKNRKRPLPAEARLSAPAADQKARFVEWLAKQYIKNRKTKQALLSRSSAKKYAGYLDVTLQFAGSGKYENLSSVYELRDPDIVAAYVDFLEEDPEYQEFERKRHTAERSALAWYKAFVESQLFEKF